MSKLVIYKAFFASHNLSQFEAKFTLVELGIDYIEPKLCHNFFLSISSSWVNLRLYTENQLYTLPGSALKVCLVVGVEGEFSDQIWLWPSRTIDSCATPRDQRVHTILKVK